VGHQAEDVAALVEDAGDALRSADERCREKSGSPTEAESRLQAVVTQSEGAGDRVPDGMGHLAVGVRPVHASAPYLLPIVGLERRE